MKRPHILAARSLTRLGAAVFRGLIPLAFVWAWAKGCVWSAGAQEAGESLAGEKSAEAAKTQEFLQGYDLHYGPVSLQVLCSFHAEFTDNALNSAVNRSSDEILRPEVKLNSYWPITELNALRFSLGLGYEYYARNTALNPSAPLISPDSELALVLYAKDLRFRFHEKFSYLESIYYGNAFSPQTGQFVNLNNIGTFGRLDNLAGIAADWDLSSLVLSFAYDHEDFVSYLANLDYLTRASELLSADAKFIVGPRVRAGFEAKGSWNAYDTQQLADNWRWRAGPFVDVSAGEHVSLRAGGGYTEVLVPRTAGPGTDFTPYYAYGTVAHEVNGWLSYGLSVAHQNQYGWETANAAVTYLGIWASCRLIDRVDLVPSFWQGWGKESGPNYLSASWREDYDYSMPSLAAIYHFGERLTADVRYDFIQKESDVAFYGFHRNRVNVGVTSRF